MRLRQDEWPAAECGQLRMVYWDGRNNSSRRTLREVALWQNWGTTPRPTMTLSEPEWIDVVGDALLMRGIVLEARDGRVYEHEQMWLVRARLDSTGPPLPPFDAAPWARQLPVSPQCTAGTSTSEEWLAAHRKGA